jgi:hypothetical protein
MLKEFSIAAALGFVIWSGLPADAKCNCENKNSLDKFSEQEAEAARRLPSEADRQLARDFRNKGLMVDAAEWYQSASKKAAGELADVKAKSSEASASTTAANLQQIALHSAAVQREASSFLRQQGKLLESAAAWEHAITAEVLAEKTGAADLSTEYGTLARLYESAGKPAKAAELYRKQITVLAASKGRYSSEAAFAESQYRRLTGKAAASVARRS